MAAVNEGIVREYFESLGYLVSQPRKYVVPGRHKKADEEVDLVVFNPCVTEHSLPTSILWGASDLANVGRAIVGVRGWHTERFYTSTFEGAPDILRFAEEKSLNHARGLLGSDVIAKVLCIPRLPASEEHRSQSIEFLKQRGVDGIITFRTMLAELILHVDINRNYEKSDLLQTIRLLKNYDLLKDSQLELFGDRRIRR